MMQFHPHSGSILSSATNDRIDIYSLEKAAPSIAISTTSKHHCWSPISGIQLSSHSTSNIISIYDPRASSMPHLEIPTSHQTNRPSHSTFLDDSTLVTTGTSSTTRTRSLSLFDLRSASKPTSIIPFDPSSSPSISLTPLTDPTRRLTYLIQTHSSSIYAFDFNTPNPLPTTLQLPSTIVDAALLPSTNVDVMRAEINRIYVLTRKDEIIPVSVRIERKVAPHLGKGVDE